MLPTRSRNVLPTPTLQKQRQFGHSSLTAEERFASGTSLHIDHHRVPPWVPDVKQAAKTTNAGGSRVPQNTLHLRRKTGTRYKYSLINFLSLSHFPYSETRGRNECTRCNHHSPAWPSVDSFHSITLRPRLFSTTSLYSEVVKRKVLQL